MKFAKELERDAVPEWRIKYLDYKAGKKHIKALSKVVKKSPRGQPGQQDRSDRTSALPEPTPGPAPRPTPERSNGASASISRSSPLAHNKSEGNDLQYGSFIPSPRMVSSESPENQRNFALPPPAIMAFESPKLTRPAANLKSHGRKLFSQRRASIVSDPVVPTRHSLNSAPTPQHPGAEPVLQQSRSQLGRVLSHVRSPRKRNSWTAENNARNSDLVEEKKREFYSFLDSELQKVESFYRMKEDQAGQRLLVLRQQLHEMKNRRVSEIPVIRENDTGREDRIGPEYSKDKIDAWVRPIKAWIFPLGPNSKAMRDMRTTPYLASRTPASDGGRDYSRRRQEEDVSYRTAKRKLKLALQEFYRGLELLKSYAMLNRTAFRKLNKKFDKAAETRQPLKYMNEKVNKAWFVNSDVLDGYVRAVEGLYGHYFERDNLKIATSKLRSLTEKPASESGSSFMNGFFVGTALVFNIEGVIYGSQLLIDDDPRIRSQTSYLLQLYAGYFLMLFMVSLFCINCFIWSKNRINYPFIFEFDQRHLLDWRRLAEFPSFFFMLLGIFMWMNFSRYGADWLYIYYPVFLISITIAIIFFPGRVLKHKSRKWFAYAHWRLLLAGIYPVEFRDFFLGDMYCSLTYSMANIELFFCLYANRWNEPSQCNSSHSRLLGFFLALPPIWRLFQCLRRYYDTRNIFPHLANGGKYVVTICAAVTLSLYRMNNTSSTLALFIALSSVNAIYVSIWDLLMDFSLLQPDARRRGLRDILAFKSPWPYYFIMTVDPVLRFVWIFYAIFTHDSQHSNIISFVVSFMEILRRGMWALFRVENEHCANVSQYKASRDVPLPYRIEPLMDRASSESSPAMEPDSHAQQGHLAQTASSTTAVGTPRRLTDTARSLSKTFAGAHMQDFEKRRKPGSQEAEREERAAAESDDDDDDDDDDEDDDDNDDNEDGQQEGAGLMMEAGEARGHARPTGNHRSS